MNRHLYVRIISEPYRLFFPLGVLYVVWGALVWVPQIWSPGDYPVLAHRYLMLNGFVGSFIAGFLMTAIPKFSRTQTARDYEVFVFLFATALGVAMAYASLDKAVALISAGQALMIFIFLLTRIYKRQVNPPYSFIFIFVGLFLWLISGGMMIFSSHEMILRLHYEGAIMSIILGVGSRLLPGILGHVEIVAEQRKMYERPVQLLSTVPPIFFLFILSFVGSYFLKETEGATLRALVVSIIAFKYWLLWKAPADKTALTWSIWACAWLIVLSFILRASWTEGMIHAGHAFFISGVVLLCLLIATRVVQSHGPKDKRLEQSRILYVVTALLLFSAVTRVSAFLVPEHYLTCLGYSALLLVLAVLVWARKYLLYIRTF